MEKSTLLNLYFKNVIKLYFSFVIFLGLFISTQAQNRKLDKSTFTIIKYSFNEWIPFDSVKGATLTDKEIDNMEPLITAAVNENNRNQKSKGFKLFTLHNYRRQYIAVINRKGEKVVWVNFFCDSNNLEWRKEVIVVEDGGNCYFNLKINLSTKAVYELFVNGYA